MGRKKSKRTGPKKAIRAKLEKAFACPFCNHEGTIECKLYGGPSICVSHY